MARNDQHIHELQQVSREELTRAQGGARVDYYLKVDGIDGEATAADDVWVDGKIITGQNFNSVC